MEIIKYAPVVIPTLNRFEHFKRCLDSLEQCTGAEHTDVYIGLDYPPSEKYVEGWKKIDDYLKKKEHNNKFGNLYVRRRDHNCGIGGPNGNGSLLYKEIKEVTDRYIFSEDDNEFSPCFLEYMNKALEKYKDDQRIICVCGYSATDVIEDDNIYFSREMISWGIGRWIEKRKKTSKFITIDSLKSVLKNYQSSMLLYRYRPVILNRVMDQVSSGSIYTDVCYTCYCLFYNCYCVYPSKNLVRNWGHDGSGLHSIKIGDAEFRKKVILKQISQDAEFKIDDVTIGERDEVKRAVKKLSAKKWYGNLFILLRYFVWRLSNKDIYSSVRKLRNKRR